MQINIGTTVQLHLGDCLERLKLAPAASIDLVLCDLPYGNVTACDWDVCIDLEAFWTEVRRILKPKGIVIAFAAQPFTTKLIVSNIEWFRYSLVWEKSRPTGFQRSSARPLTSHEDILFFSPGNAASGPQNAARRTTYNPQGLIPLAKPLQRKAEHRMRYLGRQVWPGTEQTMTNFPRSVLRFDSVSKSQHPTQKPVDLLRYLIRTYSNAGEAVLDPTMGVGSVGVAAAVEGRTFIGIELSAAYFDIADDRVSRAHQTARESRNPDAHQIAA
jgi:site-specific DNA-methyltransferase (adenine-specific)